MHFLASSLRKTLKSSLTATHRTWVLSQHSYSTIPSNSSRYRSADRATNSEPPNLSKAPTKEADWPRPTEIPYQPKVANSVNLIGYVNQAVQFEASSDGKFWAGTVVSQRSSPDSSSTPASDSDRDLWIPIIFEGDLAHTAACHLKKNDRVHIAGQLFVDTRPCETNLAPPNVQVMAHSLHFVESSLAKKDPQLCYQKEGVLKHSVSVNRVGGLGVDRWNDLLQNPEEWWDYREKKKNNLVKPKHPDFKKKDESLSLWLDSAPSWVLSDLDLKDLKFDIPVSRPRPAKYGDEAWTDLVTNPDKWWDNRSDKINPRSPDFKHKETGVALWLSDSPSWVSPKLPPLKTKAAAAIEESHGSSIS